MPGALIPPVGGGGGSTPSEIDDRADDRIEAATEPGGIISEGVTEAVDRTATPKAVAAVNPTFPVLTKYEDNPILVQSQTGLVSILDPGVVDTIDGTQGMFNDGEGRYALTISTDHGSGTTAGWKVFRSDSKFGPWTAYGTKFQDPASTRSQEETPRLLWNPDPSPTLLALYPGGEADNGLWHCYYQAIDTASISAQTTCLAVSTDLLTWTVVGVVLGNNFHNRLFAGGEFHFGYARVFRVGARWIAYHLVTGGVPSTAGISYSPDGVVWRTDPRELGNMTDFIDDPERRFTWISSTLVEYRGRWWVIGSVKTFTSGTDTDPHTKWIMAPLTADFRSFAAEPFYILPPEVQAWEGDEWGGPQSVLVEEGVMYIYYRGGGLTGGIGVAVGS